MSPPQCHYCSRPITIGTPITLWDGEAYCSPCVDSVDPELAEYAHTYTELAETLTPEDLQLWRGFTKPWNAGGLLVIFGLMFACLCLMVAVMPNDAGICCGCCGLVSILFLLAVFFVSFESSYEVARSGLPRTVRVADEKLVIETTDEPVSVTLARCDWFSSKNGLIKETNFLPRRPTIIIYHPKSGYFAVGLTPEMYRVWYAFLTLARVRNRGAFPGLRLVMGWMVGIPLGMGLGVGLGRLLKDLTGDDQLPLAYGLLGTLDGFCIPIVLILSRWTGAAKSKQVAQRSWKFVGRYALAFAMLGVFVVGGRGVGIPLLTAGLYLIMLNTFIGFIVGLWCRRATSPPVPKKLT